MSIGNLKIGLRLGLGFGVILVLMMGLTAVGMSSMGRIQDHLDEIANDNVHKLNLVQTMSESVHIVSRVTRTLVLVHEEATVKAEMQKIEAARSHYATAVQDLEKTPANEAGKAIRAKMREARVAARPLNDKVIELAHANKDAEALDVLMKQAGPATQKWQDALDEYIQLQNDITKEDVQSADKAYESARNIMFLLAGAALLLGGLIAWWLTRCITRPLSEAVEVAQKVAAGDLTSVIEAKTKDETGLLLQALKDMNDSLKKIVGEVRSGSEAIGSGTKQIASGNADLSQRTEEQASSLEETASSMEELTSTVKQNAENAKQANQLALGASAVAVKGGQVVSEVVTTMSSINESSKKIVDIIGVIDGIAFQTNILALNAAVEAARAGEQGRGFAVVASEVRNLAQRSAAAAKEIKALIGDSVDKVGAGTKLVDEAGKTMEEIVISVKRVTDIMSEITAASQEQSAGIEQVNQAITQMDEVTQQNAALVEEAAAAAESLEEQAQNLEAAVAVFNVGKAAAGRSTEVMVKREQAARPQAERRGPNRAPNVARLPGRPAKAQLAAPRAKVAAAGGGEDKWEQF